MRNQSENAVKAAKAYESIVDAIKEARTSAEKALDDAKVSKKIVSVSYLLKWPTMYTHNFSIVYFFLL